jgi:signal transduction histidine kinase
MRERAKLLGGSFEITSETGKGTRLTVTMPAGEKKNGQ